MEKKVIIGIDVSKSWLDAHVLLIGSQEGHALRIHNTVAGFTKLVKFVKKQTEVNNDDWLFCMEHTGVLIFSNLIYIQFLLTIYSNFTYLCIVMLGQASFRKET